MRVRTSILDSQSEKQLFAAIAGAWEPAYKLYPQVPFTNLIELDQTSLSAVELGYLHRTSVDFVLSDTRGTPLLGIEFDGLGHGLSTRGQYCGAVPSARDPSRAWKLGLKVRIADTAGFPFVVISYDEKALVDPDTNLTVAHGIVGSFLARIATQERVQELVEEEADRLAHLPEHERQEELQDMVMAAELDAEYDWNPIFRRSIELSGALYKVAPEARIGHAYDQDPPRPERCEPLELDCDFDAFAKWWRSVRRFGVTCTITGLNWEVARTVWVRNFEGTGVTPFGWMDELSEVVTIPAALQLLKGQTSG